MTGLRPMTPRVGSRRRAGRRSSPSTSGRAGSGLPWSCPTGRCAARADGIDPAGRRADGRPGRLHRSCFERSCAASPSSLASSIGGRSASPRPGRSIPSAAASSNRRTGPRVPRRRDRRPDRSSVRPADGPRARHACRDARRAGVRGRPRGAATALYLTVSTGFGGAIVSDGHLVTGPGRHGRRARPPRRRLRRPALRLRRAGPRRGLLLAAWRSPGPLADAIAAGTQPRASRPQPRSRRRQPLDRPGRGRGRGGRRPGCDGDHGRGSASVRRRDGVVRQRLRPGAHRRRRRLARGQGDRWLDPAREAVAHRRVPGPGGRVRSSRPNSATTSARRRPRARPSLDEPTALSRAPRRRRRCRADGPSGRPTDPVREPAASYD